MHQREVPDSAETECGIPQFESRIIFTLQIAAATDKTVEMRAKPIPHEIKQMSIPENSDCAHL